MKAAGLEAVACAKKDGRWDAAYDSPRAAKVPEDFQAALDGNARDVERAGQKQSRDGGAGKENVRISSGVDSLCEAGRGWRWNGACTWIIRPTLGGRVSRVLWIG